MVIVRALSLGFSTGVFCLGFCYPILGPLLLSRRESTGGYARSLTLFLAGRLAAYLLFGLITGMVGGSMSGLGRCNNSKSR